MNDVAQPERIRIEIGENLKNSIKDVIRAATKKGLSPGEEVKKAFGLNLTEAAIQVHLVNIRREHKRKLVESKLILPH